MSENTSLPARKASRRVARTQDRLGDALIALLLAKPFSDITVQEVLDRAEVSRSTFYEQSGRMDDVRELGEAHFARSIARRLARQPWTAALTSTERNALAHALAGSLFSLLSWWMRQGNLVTPSEMDRLFHRTVSVFGNNYSASAHSLL